MITALSLILLLATVAVVFAARSLLQYRRTGDSGWRAPARSVDPSQAGARLVMATAFLTLLAAPITDLAGLLPRLSMIDSTSIRITGLTVATISALAVIAAQLGMGASWRIGVDPDETTALVTSGAFALVRNPIFTAMIAFTIGLAAAVPNLAAITGATLAIIGIQWQVRKIEEPHLNRTHGDTYLTYTTRTGRFLPGIGRLHH